MFGFFYKIILDRVFPDLYIPSVYQLPLLDLKKRGIKTLVFDIDNTISPYDIAEPDESLIAFFKELRAEGFRLCILSNNNKRRVRHFNKPLRALAVYRSNKPGISKLMRALKALGTAPSSAAMIGDQIFTDMFCGHRAGLYCIMTAPICKRDQLVTKVKRGAERVLMKQFFKHNPERVLKLKNLV